eukprot:232710_1
MPRRVRKKRKLKKRSARAKLKDIKLAETLGDVRYNYYAGKKVRATVVQRSTLRAAVKTSKQEFGLGWTPKSKRHRIYFNLFKIYVKWGYKGTQYWDYITLKRVRKLYPDDDD